VKTIEDCTTCGTPFLWRTIGCAECDAKESLAERLAPAPKSEEEKAWRAGYVAALENMGEYDGTSIADRFEEMASDAWKERGE
jgi:hypothetical protein